MTYAIETHGLVKRYGDKAALAGIDLAAPPGTVLGVLGPNGAGKTTAVRILATLVRPDAGRAAVGGHDVVKAPAEVRKLIGLTGQYASVDEKLTGRQNLVMTGRLLGMSRADARGRAAALLAEFALEDAADRAAGSYSGGMRRRLDLAVSLVGRPSIVFMDEPTTGLDPRARTDLWRIAREQPLAGVALLMLFAPALSWVSAWLGLKAKSVASMQGMATAVLLPLTFGSSAFIPPANLPAVLRRWSSDNPISHLADAVRALLTGAPVGVHVWVTLAWAAAVTACFVPLAVRAYTRRIR